MCADTAGRESAGRAMLPALHSQELLGFGLLRAHLEGCLYTEGLLLMKSVSQRWEGQEASLGMGVDLTWGPGLCRPSRGRGGRHALPRGQSWAHGGKLQKGGIQL